MTATPQAPTGAIAQPVIANTSIALNSALSVAPGLYKSGFIELLEGWITGSAIQLNGAHVEELIWFISKKAHELINTWLMNNHLSALTPLSPTNTGLILISRVRVEHVRDSRTNKDSISLAGTAELLEQLFASGNPKYAPNPRHVNQLLMFDETYKAHDPAASGESPCAALSFAGEPMPHLKLETAYWMKPAKLAALSKTALRKPEKKK
jgi:hypothetical protein